jgi:gliding motility-associatede transport system auxiliary component
MGAKLLQRLPVQLVLVALLFLSVVVVSDRFTRGIRLDLTADKLYTLSQGSRDLLANLEDQVTFEFYYSRSLATPYPQLSNYGKRVEDILRALTAASGGNITLSVIDPEPFSEAEDDAVAAGLKGVPLGDGSMFYMGLKISNDIDGEASIAFFSQERENFLEYDLIKALATLDKTGQKKLTLITSLPMQFGPGGPQAMMSGQAQPYVIYQQLGEFFDIQELAADFTDIPTDTDVLMIVHPPALSDDQLFTIDQFMLSGGRALVFLDPHSEAMNPRATAVNASNLGPLLKAWGAEMPKDKVVGDASLAQRVQMAGSIKDYIFWLAVRSNFMAKDDVITGTIDSLNFATAGVLEPIEGATTRFEPLVTTSAVAMLYDSARAVGDPDPDLLLRDLEPSGETFTLAARISGPANTAFPDRVAKDAGPVSNPLLASGKINLVLVSDSDVFDDRFWVQLQELLGQRIVVPLAGNGSFILNLADHISGSEALLALRGRGIVKRRFDVVDKLRREAEAKYRQQEQQLQSQMNATEARIAALEAQKPEGTAVLSVEQEAEIEGFRTQLLETRKALRVVNRNLRREIESVGAWLAFINIAFIPIIIVLIALVRVMMRRRRGYRAQMRAYRPDVQDET